MTLIPNIIIADRSPLYCQGICLAWQATDIKARTTVVCDKGALNDALNALKRIDLLVLDTGFTGLDYWTELGSLRHQHLNLNVLLVTEACSMAGMHRAYDTGVKGVILKSATLSQFGDALRSVLSGNQWHDHDCWSRAQFSTSLLNSVQSLSRKESKILLSLKKGMKNKQIAIAMGVTENTIKVQVCNVFRKLNVHNRTKLVVMMEEFERHLSEQARLLISVSPDDPSRDSYPPIAC